MCVWPIWVRQEEPLGDRCAIKVQGFDIQGFDIRHGDEEFFHCAHREIGSKMYDTFLGKECEDVDAKLVSFPFGSVFK